MNKIKQSIVDICKDLYKREMVSSTGGNVSIREKSKVFITPSSISFRKLKPDMIVESDLSGYILRGGRPSKETGMHLTIYKNRIDINAIIHIHSPYAVAIASIINHNNDILPALTPGFVMRVGKLDRVPYYMPGSSKLCIEVANYLKSYNAVLLQNHGLVTIGKDIEQALDIAEEVEENAKIYILTNRKGRVLSSLEIQELLDIKAAKNVQNEE